VEQPRVGGERFGGRVVREENLCASNGSGVSNRAFAVCGQRLALNASVVSPKRLELFFPPFS
jgi:hypothetical protein